MAELSAEPDAIDSKTEVVQQYNVLFGQVIRETPGPADFQRLAGGTSAVLRIPSLLTSKQCSDIMQHIDQYEFDAYDERRLYPRVTKFGPGAYDYYLDGGLRSDYWEHAEAARRVWREVMPDENPVQAVLGKLARASGMPVVPASVGGRSLFIGLLRDFSAGALMHFDEVAREFPGVFDEEPVAQFAFNCYVEVPDGGGQVTVYRRRWSPRDEAFRVGYGWQESIAREEPSVTFQPMVGEGVFFDSRNYHTVAPSSGSRITLSFFTGVTISGHLIVWS